MPGDLPIEHGNALVQRSEFFDQDGQAPPSRLGQIGGGVLQGSDELAGMDRPFGGDHSELGQVTAERIDGRVRWRTSRSRVRNTTAAAGWFALLRATKRMVGR